MIKARPQLYTMNLTALEAYRDAIDARWQDIQARFQQLQTDLTLVQAARKQSEQSNTKSRFAADVGSLVSIGGLVIAVTDMALTFGLGLAIAGAACAVWQTSISDETEHDLDIIHKAIKSEILTVSRARYDVEVEIYRRLNHIAPPITEAQVPATLKQAHPLYPRWFR